MTQSEISGSQPVGNARMTTEPLDLEHIVSLIKRRWPLFLFIAGSILLATAFVTYLLPPMYESNVVVRLQSSERATVESGTSLDVAAPDSTYVDTEAAFIVSRSVVEDVVNRLKLWSDPEFVDPLASADSGDISQTQGNTEKAIEILQKRISAERVDEGYLVSVSARARTPEKAALLADEVADAYIDLSRRLLSSEIREQTEVHEKQLDSLAREVQQADEALATYLAQLGLVDGTLGNSNQQQLEELSERFSMARADAIQATARSDAADKQMQLGGVDSVAEVLASPVVLELRRQRAEVLREDARIKDTYGPRHAQSIRVSEQLKALNAQLDNEERLIVNGLRSSAESATATVDRLEEQVARLQDQQASQTLASVEADRLRRDAQSRRLVYEQMTQVAQQSLQRMQLGGEPGRIVARASLPVASYFPNKPLFLAIGTLLGTLVALLIIVIVDVFDKRLKTVGAAENALGMPVLGAVPKLSRRQLKSKGAGSPGGFLLSNLGSIYAESLRSIRASLIATSNSASEVICVTSSLPGEGKSAFALSLARIAAASGDRVLLLDCDSRCTSMLGIGGPERSHGMIEVLTGKAQLSEAVVVDENPNLHVVPMLKRSVVPRDLYGNPRMPALLESARNQYRFVIVDAPPLLAVADAKTLASAATRTLFIVRWGETTGAAAQAALRATDSFDVKFAGAVFTQVNTSSRAAIGEHSPIYYSSQLNDYYLS